MKLRKWQQACADEALQIYKKDRHFLCLATPGAGKTFMAAEVGYRLYQERKIDYILCFSPSVIVSKSIHDTFSSRFNARFDGKIGAIGCSYTYQSMLFLDKDFWSLLKLNRVLVIFDEIHHCAGQSIDNSNSWGEEIICNIQDFATFTLALSGTPWRSDKAPIVMARYSDPEGDIQCNYIYGLKEATLENVCRLPNIVFVDNEQLTISMSDSSETTFNNLQDLLSGSDITYQDVISNVKAMQHLLALAVCRLNEIRRVNPEAGGLIVASSVQHAQSILQILHSVFVQSAVLVTYKDPKSAESIELFRDSSTQWIVSVGMVSEGTDIPRLQVCCHLSRIRTELYFRQILGRILRVNSALNQEAWLYVFAEPQLSEFAMRLKNDVPDSQVYRCGSRIVSASEYALGEARGYKAPENANEGTIFFHPCAGDYARQARYLIEGLIPEICERRPHINLGEIAVLYPAAFLGDEVANAAAEHGYSVIRTDGNALYPRSSRLMRWLEQCAMWCCGGWRSGTPSLSRVISEGIRLFHESITDEDERLIFQRDLTAVLWKNRDEMLGLSNWLTELRDDIIRSHVAITRTLVDEYATLNNFLTRLEPGGDIEDFPIAEFAGIGSGLQRINLSTLHSSKGREFDVVILFGIEEGRLPRNRASGNDLREARRLFYVGFTRAKHEIHLMYGQHNPSRFVTEVSKRLEEE
ncbi:TPA: 3'-5' exonuclease [Citrobacter freundii]